MAEWPGAVVTFTYSCVCGFVETKVENDPEPDAVFVATHYCLLQNR